MKVMHEHVAGIDVHKKMAKVAIRFPGARPWTRKTDVLTFGTFWDELRAMAGELRRVGGFAKETMPFNEFLWADFLRRRITLKAVQSDFTHAMEKALDLVKSEDANYLPGWCGPTPGG